MSRLKSYPALILSLLTMGCSNSLPQPILVYRQSDLELSCQEIENEVESILITNIGLKKEIKDTKQDNLALFITGQLLLFPTLGMDVTGSREIELNAYTIRLSRLKDLADMKVCKFERNL